MDRYIKRNDVYALFDKSGMAKLHVADIDVIQDADVVPVVHGRWLERIGRAKCSVCHDECWALSALSYNYCPNCGAKMGE